MYTPWRCFSAHSEAAEEAREALVKAVSFQHTTVLLRVVSKLVVLQAKLVLVHAKLVLVHTKLPLTNLLLQLPSRKPPVA